MSKNAQPHAITRNVNASRICGRKLNLANNAGSRRTRPDPLLARLNPGNTRGNNGNAKILMSVVRDAGDKR